MNSLNDIRAAFLDYFASAGHERVASAPLVPQDDPTLMFVNAGMVPFKNVFVGAETRDYVRATSSQACVRAGGKHNDLDNVGYTARHHTFFEMLGNFSFGDYFKEEAILHAWRVLKDVFELPEDKLLVTVFHTDDDAFDLWRKISGLPEDRIIRISTNDNFWSMGDTGPCGPCSEIFYDHGPEIAGGPPGSPDEDGDRFVEIWNLVFMQFEALASGEQVDLPRPSIDTGMGLERIGAVLQGRHDNYETDLFRKLMAASSDILGAPLGAPGEAVNIAHRVIADHLRASCFLIADGVTPSNEGRGYVLRRIMRRAMRYAHNIGGDRPVLSALAPTLIAEMGAAFPQLERARAALTETLAGEEERFLSLLSRGSKLLEDERRKLPEGAAFPGEAAFKLYDTYGFPIDLIEDALRRDGLTVDRAAFDAAMERQRAEARANWSGSGGEATDAVWFEVRKSAPETRFLGYEADSAEGRIVAILAGGHQTDRVEAGQVAEIVTDQTPFYAESGGQIGDAGRISLVSGDGEAQVTNVAKRAEALHSHLCEVTKGALSVGDAVRLEIDEERRSLIRANHSATHLLHAALRARLGAHVAQKGSAVTAERLRFDFSHGKAVTTDELEQIEADVNEVIARGGAVATQLMAQDDALKAGAVALFGEKYGDEVRVLSMGRPAAGEGAYSVELCGGTHVANVGEIRLFAIASESAVGSGVRRIEALTGEAARAHLASQGAIGRQAADLLKTPLGELPERVAALSGEVKSLRRELEAARKKLAVQEAMGPGAGGAAAPSQGE
ncbi:MAG: alanine--tRNA ligase, partial [Pseudomonadota bacterium]